MKKLTLFSSLAAAATVAALVLFGSCENPTDAEKSTPADPATLKNITAFSFASPAATGTVSASTIAVTVPFGTDVTALVATFTTNGESVKVGDVAQVSGTTANNFTNPVTYTVTAKDASTKTYIVTVTVAPEDTSPKVDISKVMMHISVYPTTDLTPTKADYAVYCSVKDEANSDYKNIDLKVNEVQIPFSNKSEWGNTYSSYSLGELSAGDTVSVIIRDTQLGVHTYTLTVPSTLTDFTLTPELVAGTPATSTSYTLSWNAITGVSEYSVGMGQCFESGGAAGSARTVQTTQETINSTKQPYTDFFGKDWIFFEVEAISSVNITGFKTFSTIQVKQPGETKKTNYVHAD